MARRKNTQLNQEEVAPLKNKSTSELQSIFASQGYDTHFAESEKAKIQLRDLSKNQTKTIRTFNKETLRTYLQSLGANEENLRNLSWFLYYRSMVYMRLCNLYPNILQLNCRSVIPQTSLTKTNKDKALLASFEDTIDKIKTWHFEKEFRDIALDCMVQDVFYGVWIEDEEGLFIWSIPAQYGRIAGKYKATGDFSYAMDMSYIRSHQELLEYMPDPLQSMYNEFQKTNQKWQLVPDEYSICIKFRCEDYETILPPFTPLFNSLINLADLEDVQATADALSIYKMVWLEMDTLDKADMADQWKVNPALMIQYFNRMLEDALPDYVTGAIVPGKLNSISFDDQPTNDTNKVTKATEAVLNSAGGAELLNGATISGAEAFRVAQIITSNFVLKPLLPQFEGVINRHLSYSLANPSYVKFHEVTSLTLNNFKEDLRNNILTGFPAKLLMGATIGLDPKQIMSLNYLEEDILGLTEKFSPPETSYNRSLGSNPTGRPRSAEQTTDGENAEDKRDRAKG